MGKGKSGGIWGIISRLAEEEVLKVGIGLRLSRIGPFGLVKSLIAFHQMTHGFVKPIQSKFKHREDLFDCLNGADICPLMLEPGV